MAYGSENEDDEDREGLEDDGDDADAAAAVEKLKVERTRVTREGAAWNHQSKTQAATGQDNVVRDPYAELPGKLVLQRVAATTGTSTRTGRNVNVQLSDRVYGHSMGFSRGRRAAPSRCCRRVRAARGLGRLLLALGRH